MSDVTLTPDRVLTRLLGIAEGFAPEDRAAYFFACLGILGHHAPAVLDFLIDRVEEKLTPEAAPS